jgi:Sel1 repeat
MRATFLARAAGETRRPDAEFAIPLEIAGWSVKLVGMSSSSVIALFPTPGRGKAARNPVADLASASGVAAGLPVEHLPPVVEPTGFADPATPEPAGRRPPRRSFLAPAARPAAGPEAAPHVPPEPVPEPAAAPAARLIESPAPMPAGTTPPPGDAAEPAAAAPIAPVAEIMAVQPDSIAPAAEPLATPHGDPPITPLAAVPVTRAEAAPPGGPPAEMPLLVEPAIVRREPVLRRVRERVAGWLSMATALLPAGRWRSIAAGVAILLLIVVVYVAGVGRFSGLRHYRQSPPPSDPAARVAYYQMGANGGDAEAELQLAILYAKGEGVQRDVATAATWFRAAAEQGLPRAQFDLGIMYERGRGVPVDLTEAAKWYRKAAESKHPLAQYNLAVCYTKGQGVREDLPEAALWYRRAAVQGVVQAMINLGMMYEKGEGVAASPVDAYAWYLAAGRRDSQPAAEHAREIFAGLPKLDQIRAEALASDVGASIHDPGRSEPR